MLALHVILGAMLGAALSAHNENIFLQQQFKYDSLLVYCFCLQRRNTCMRITTTGLAPLSVDTVLCIALCCNVWQNDTVVSSSSKALFCLRHSLNLQRTMKCSLFTCDAIAQCIGIGHVFCELHVRVKYVPCLAVAPRPTLLLSIQGACNKLLNTTLLCAYRCSQLQAASAGCGNDCGNCALLNTCTAAVIASSCPTCQAYPAEFCNNLASNRIIIGIIVSCLVAAAIYTLVDGACSVSICCVQLQPDAGNRNMYNAHLGAWPEPSLKIIASSVAPVTKHDCKESSV